MRKDFGLRSHTVQGADPSIGVGSARMTATP